MNTSDGDSIFNEWDLYDSIVQFNWMRHRELANALRDNLEMYTTPIRVLDLGCGDGWLAERILSACSVEQYTGIDSSQAAMDRHAVRPLPGRDVTVAGRNLLLGDILAELPQLPDADYDVVVASYSLHHFVTEQKETVLHEIGRLVKPTGCFLWADVIRSNAETREEFLSRLTTEISERWTSLSVEQRMEAVDHIWKCDFPEREAWMREELARWGLAEVQPLFRDDFFGLLSFEKAR